MVERKKTGLAKARKRVSHLFSVDMHNSHSSLPYFSTPGLSGDLKTVHYDCPWHMSRYNISVIVPSVENGRFMREDLCS